ncbi:MAG: carbohydrate ABC transporter permease [Anaerolineales bacterium]
MNSISKFLTTRRGGRRADTTDVLSYIFLLTGVLVMFGPIVWLVLSSFKTSGEIVKFPPRLLPYRQEMVTVAGYEDPLPLFNVTFEDGSTATLAQVRRVGLESQLVDPANPDEIIRVNINQREPVEQVYFGLENYIEGVRSFNFGLYLWNSIVVTGVATLLTLLVNSMAAFALSKYRFRGSQLIFVIMISTLMVPISVILVPVFLVITNVGWNNNLLGIIIPAAATPTGVFMLRQYMLTIPDELIDAARIDGASEWRIYAQIVMPLAKPAVAVLAIFSVMWRWNDFLWPLIVLSRSEYFTLQVGLASFQGELNVQWNLILAMTVLTLLPITLVFGVLQRYITTGIATTGLK